MKRKIIALTAAAIALMLAMVGCVPDSESNETTAPETEKTTETTVADTTTADTEAADKYFEYSEVEGGYSYNLYNLDGSLAEEMDFCSEMPSHSLLFGTLSKITVGSEVYYYDHNTRAFSETFTDVYDENGTLFIRSEGEIIIISDIFENDGVYKEFSDFTYELSEGEESPFVSCRFIDGGGSIKVVYLTGEERAERIECFNITNGTHYVSVDDWKNKKDLISGAEKESVEAFLRSYMGTHDYNTGFQLAYEVSGSLEINGVRYYHCECFYVMVEEDGTEKLVSCAEFVLSESKNERYDCRDKDGELIVYTENNMI